uniref:Uncharacterized protein n=1 Tax=Acrobeloides nanus TaxID=290746 RepID=A0A914C738_9BILA
MSSLMFPLFEKRSRSAIFVLVSYISWLIGSGLFSIYMTPYTTIVYDFTGFYWSFGAGIWTRAMIRVTNDLSHALLLISLLVYLLAGALLAYRKFISKEKIPQAASPELQRKHLEKRIFIQASINFLLLGIFILLYYQYMQSTKFLLQIAVIWLGISQNLAAICGPDSVPHRLTAYPNGQIEVGCSKPSCFEIQLNSQTLESSSFYRAASEGLQVAESAENFRLSVFTCEQISFSQQCPVNTFLFENGPSNTPNNYLVCCSNQHTAFTHENLVYVPLGQELVGGKILVNSQQVGFDYISDVTKMLSYKNETVYQVKTKRVYCLDPASQTTSAPVNTYGTSNQQISNLETYNPFQNLASNSQTNQQTKALGVPNVQIDQQQQAQGVANVQAQPSSQQAIAQGVRTHDVPTVVEANGQDVIIYRGPAASYSPPQSAPAQSAGYYPAATGGAGLFCFSGDTEVIMNDGETKRMDELKVGDWIMSVDNSNKLVYSRVKSWIHKLPQQQADFLKLTLSDETTLKITPQHLIYKTDCIAVGQRVKRSEFNKTAIASDELRVGDCLYTSVQHSGQFIQNRIENIEIVKETGVYAPLTTTGNIVVNDVLASCYSVADHSTLQINFAKFIEKFGELSRRIFGTTNLLDEAELPLSSQIILQMMNALLPSLSF